MHLGRREPPLQNSPALLPSNAASSPKSQGTAEVRVTVPDLESRAVIAGEVRRRPIEL
jgi:hypothetical protein